MDLINMELLQTTLIIASFLAIILFFSNLFDVFNEKIMGPIYKWVVKTIRKVFKKE